MSDACIIYDALASQTTHPMSFLYPLLTNETAMAMCHGGFFFKNSMNEFLRIIYQNPCSPKYLKLVVGFCSTMLPNSRYK